MFKFLLIVFLIFFLIGPVIRLGLRTFLMNKVMKEQKNYQKAHSRKEGEVRIDNATPSRPQRTDDNEGQYIDYEEVK